MWLSSLLRTALVEGGGPCKRPRVNSYLEPESAFQFLFNSFETEDGGMHLCFQLIGRLRQDSLSLGVQGQPRQYSKTLSL
jgi:hypothetical protein